MLVIGPKTTMTTHMIDYHTTVFEYPNLTKIHGEPIFEGFQVIHKELMVNTQKVQSDLGSGAHVHLGLVLSPQRYTWLISNACYVCNIQDNWYIFSMSMEE